MKPNEALFPGVAAWENEDRQRERRAAQRAPRFHAEEPDDWENNETPRKSSGKRMDHGRNDASLESKSVQFAVGPNTPVRVRDLNTNEEITFTIVDSENIDENIDEKIEMSTNRISFASPVGIALLWRRVGDAVRIALPQGQVHYEIICLAAEAGE